MVQWWHRLHYFQQCVCFHKRWYQFYTAFVLVVINVVWYCLFNEYQLSLDDFEHNIATRKHCFLKT